MRVLDLFCCGGGASRGLARAGFDVVGVDIEPQPGYPYEFRLGDALDADLSGFDLVWASPPCQGYSPHVSSRSSKWVPTRGKDEPRLIEPLRTKLHDAGVPYVIENVRGARDALHNPMMLCGVMMGLPIQRHRFFETNWRIDKPFHPDCKGIAKTYAASRGWEYRDMSVTGKGRRVGTADRWKEILGIEAEAPMTQHQLAEAIPPAYSFYIARCFLSAMRKAA